MTTGFSDLVSYQNETLTIYAYPVIGRTVCPSGNSNCTDSEKIPLTVNMTGPDTLSYLEAQPGAVLPWYQPPWIPGNLLSYPGNDDQLKAAAFQNVSDFQELSQPATWFTGDGTTNASATWTGGGSTGKKSSFKQNYSFEDDISFSGQVGIEDAVTFGFDQELDLSGSFGFSNLTDSLKTLSATQGIDFTRTASFDDFNYGYEITPHIFGKFQPPTVVDDTNCGGQSCDNQDLVFWVVVWIENGGLVSELPEHGLNSIPAEGDDFLDIANLDPTKNRAQPYSNNLGFYNQVFHIFPQTPAPLASTPMEGQAQHAPTPTEGEIGAQLIQVGAAHRALRRGQSTALAAKVQTGGRDLKGGLEVAFYDGNPIGGGKLIGLQHLPHLNAQSTYDFRVLFTPQQCGKHTVYIVAGADTRHEHTAKLRPIQVKGKGCKSGGRPG